MIPASQTQDHSMAETKGTPRTYHPDRAFNCEIPEHLRGKKVRATWITYKERSIWCCDFAGYESDPQGLLTEIEVSDSVIKQQPENSLLVAVVLDKRGLTPEIAEFFRINTARTPNPIRKMAVLFLPGFRRRWYEWVQHGVWPAHTGFLDDYEKAKEWLIKESF
jgi:hypothetical protein